MKPAYKNLIFLLSLTATISACEVKKNLDEMHDSTIEMNHTTKDMSDTTKEMNERTIDLGNTTEEMYNALRQGDAMAARRSALDNLIKTSDPARKLSEAVKYFMSYDFQFWTDQGQDRGNEKRLDLGTLAAREFFKDVLQFIPGGELNPSPFKGQFIATEKSNLVNSFNALSVGLHFLNPKQEQHLRTKKGMKPLSMYIMIEEALLAKASIESGEKRLTDFPGYVTEVLANESIAIYLLESRYNYLATLFLARSTNIANSTIAASKIILTQWTLDLSRFNSAQLEELNKLADGAVKTKELLKKISVKPRMSTLLARMLKNMNLQQGQNKAATPEKSEFLKGISGNILELKNL